MLKIQPRSAKVVALLTGGVLMASTLATTTAPAHAKPSKEKLYKGGAVALGVLGAYWILKGKTVPGAVAAAGGYYAYKKGQKENNRENDHDYYDWRRSDRDRDYRSSRNYDRDYNRYDRDDRDNDRDCRLR
jgi:hypothetical protein